MINIHLSSAAEAAIWAGVDRMRGFRAIAATVIARHCRDIVAGWEPDAESVEHIGRIITRWHLGDAYCALLAGYKQDAAHRGPGSTPGKL